MTDFALKSFDDLVSEQVTEIQSQLPNTLSFTPGSIPLALVEANAGVALWLEAQLSFLMAITRLTTSTGSYADSFVEQFGLTRLPAVAATGNVTFARFTPSQQAFVTVGRQVTTTTGNVSFTVIADTTNPDYNPSLEAYVIPAGISSVQAKVQCNTAGLSGNVVADAINVISSPISGVDTCSNALAFTNGEAQQSDAELRQYFIDYLNSLSKATLTALEFAVESVQEGLKYIIVENEAYDGTEQLGYFYIVVDDGSGSPSGDLLSAVYDAVDAVRGFTIQFDVFAPVTVAVNITATIVVDSNYTAATVESLCETALEDYIASISFGGTIDYFMLAKVILDASPGVTNITTLLLNGGTSDVTVAANEEFIAGTITVST
jgi:hypothetical protein